MTQYEIYVDESYSEDPSILVVGGYIFKAAAAQQLTSEWEPILKKSPVTYFHMKEIQPHKRHGDFKKLTDAEACQMSIEMHDIIKSNAMSGFAVALNPARFWDIEPWPHDPYAHALNACVEELASSFRFKDPDAQLTFIFEAGHDNGPSALKVLEKNGAAATDDIIRRANYQFVEKKKSCPVQAADVLVWHFRKYVADRISAKRKLRVDFRSLLAIEHTFYLSWRRDDQLQGGSLMQPWLLEEADIYQSHLATLFAYAFGPPGGRVPFGYE